MNKAPPNHRRLFAALLIVACSVLLSACGALQIMSNTSPSSHYVKSADIRYGEAQRNLLDYYVPVNAASDAPLVIFFYGGGWRGGNRTEYEFVASAFTRAGFRVVIPDYQLYPEVTFPVFMEDAAAAVAWAVDHERSSASQTEGIYLVGHSAGAHIAALLATDQAYLTAVSVPESALLGLVGLSGPYDFLPIEPSYLLEVFPEENREDSQPINFVTPATPPTLLIHGADDKVVEAGNAERFAAALREAGVPVTVDIYEGTGHRAVAAAMAPYLDFLADTLQDTITFISGQEQKRLGE